MAEHPAAGSTKPEITAVRGGPPVEPTPPPVTCSYCHLRIVEHDDHATDCCWCPGKATAQ
ncbi:hypothetical protein E1265_14575 [Streptomyces sp. 8K308]|uniref:hypothetical protein n=1 Tax=Streptomyces sp. 8K308 TaxID=2530388 RepID=UPI00104B9A83|nr:hypothetical protein [Streptomyces sp. 8K308]TDC22835.1 hypothetical protein E1265_14575 [Streptomyces sp. 8K308]